MIFLTMDVQRTMDFILEQQAQAAVRQAEFEQKFSAALGSLTSTVEKLADHVTRLDEVMETLAEAQIQNQERFRQTDDRFRETDERFRQTDARIATLVSAMGEYLGRQKH